MGERIPHHNTDAEREIMVRVALALIVALFLSRAAHAQDPGETPDSGNLPEADSAALRQNVPPLETVRAAGGEFLLPSCPPLSLAFLPEQEVMFDALFATVDTLPPAVKVRLLPDNMSFMERGLWGEDGLMRSIGIASPLTPDVRKHELAVRRTMLTAHQIGGFVTLGLMLATDYYGQQYLNHGQRDMLDMHKTFLTATIISYSLTGALAILSPPPMIRRGETSTTSIHKTLAWIHFAGMVLTPILGMMISRRGASYYEQAHFHQVSAYVTTSVFAASMIVILF
jgi:hypothetical protein